MAGPESLTVIANRQVPMAVACRLAGLDIRAGKAKGSCPRDLLHPDGGRDPAFRVYYADAWCVDMETEILSRRGWLTGDQVEQGEVVLTYRDGATRWEEVQGVIHLPAMLRSMLSMETKTHSSLTTRHHRWFVRRCYEKPVRGPGRPRKEGPASQPLDWEVFRTSGSGFKTLDTVPYIGGPCLTVPAQPSFSDDFAALVGWFFTEGHIRADGRVRLYQSQAVNPENCDRIRGLLKELYPEGWSESTRTGKTEFRLRAQASADLVAAAPGRVVRPEFVTALTAVQLRLFTEAAMAGDGSRIGQWAQLCQKQRDMLDSFQIALLLQGIPARIWHRLNSGTRNGGEVKAPDWACQLLNSQGFRPAYAFQQGHARWVAHEGPVWCVQVPSGTWVARRHGTVYVTGNCFSCSQFWTPVSLYAEVTQTTPEVAAQALLDAVGYKPASHAHLWQLSGRAPEPDREALKQALRNFCGAADLHWPEHRTDPWVADCLSQCFGFLVSVADEQGAAEWLRLSQVVMTACLAKLSGTETAGGHQSDCTRPGGLDHPGGPGPRAWPDQDPDAPAGRRGKAGNAAPAGGTPGLRGEPLGAAVYQGPFRFGQSVR